MILLAHPARKRGECDGGELRERQKGVQQVVEVEIVAGSRVGGETWGADLGVVSSR